MAERKVMIQRKIEEYKTNKQEAVLDEIRKYSENEKALAFLYTLEKEKYREKFQEAGEKIYLLNRDENGLFIREGIEQEELLFEVLPVYALYDTEFHQKGHYNDLVSQCREAVKKYPNSEKIFAALAEVLEYMSEQIYEHYRTVQDLLWKQFYCFSDVPSDMVCYGLAKGCFYHAFLLEKYETVLQKVLQIPKEYPLSYYAVRRLEKRFDRFGDRRE